ncbi:MAG TPA: hypothetical protein VGP44_04355, partial [Gemmatimonadales bacterium]|nr:hypothetical protein [Gemmatimonadales bacterium]
MASVAAAIAERQDLAACVEDLAQRTGRADQRFTILDERLLPQAGDLIGLEHDRSTHIGDHRRKVVLLLAKKGIEQTGGTGIVYGAGFAPAEQSAMVEENVHQLPEHMVQRLRQLLAHEGIIARRTEFPLRAGPPEGDGETS